MEKKTYIIAAKRSVASLPSPDWQQRVAAIDGVVLVGATRHQAQFLADADTAEQVSAELGGDFTIEERVDRGPVSNA